MSNKRLETTFPTPRHFKVLHQFLSISDIEPEEESFAGFTELTVIPLREDLRVIRLNCSSQVQIERIAVNDAEAKFSLSYPFKSLEGSEEVRRGDLRQISVAAARAAAQVDAEQGGGELEIRLPPTSFEAIKGLRALKVGLDFAVEKPKMGLRFLVPRHEFPRAGSDEADVSEVESSTSQEEGATSTSSIEEKGVHLYTYRSVAGGCCSSHWFPCVDAWNELCLWKIEVRVRSSWTVVASGELTETVYSPDMLEKTFHYALAVPTSSANIGLAAGPFHIAVHPEMNELSAFCPPGLLPLLRHTTAGLDKVAEFFEELLASRLPYPSYKAVFVSELGEDTVTYAGLSLLPLHLLYHRRLIDPVMLSRSCLAHAVAAQFFSAFLCPASWDDLWLLRGIARYITGLYMQKVFGNNEYLIYLNKTQTQVTEYESTWGGIRLRSPEDEPSSFCGLHFDRRSQLTASPLYVEAAGKKAHLVLRLLEKKLGLDLLFQVLVKLVSLGASSKEAGLSAASWQGLLVSSDSFFKAVAGLTGQELPTFTQLWISGSGHPHFAVQVSFNRKRNMVELEIEQKPQIRGRIKYVGPLKVTVQELDGSFTHTVQIDDVNSRHELACHSKTRRQKKRKIPLWTTEEVEMDLAMSDADSPVLWVRIDPDLGLIRRLIVNQPDYHWLYQLKYERDVLAQMQALEMLPKFPSAQARQTLLEVIDMPHVFYRVRTKATVILAEVSNRLSVSSSGPTAMHNLWKSKFASLASSRLPRLNNFSNFVQYYLMQAIPAGMARLRSGERLEEASPIVTPFLLELLRLNDNTGNAYSDDHYRAGLLLALAVAAGKPNFVRGSPGAEAQGDRGLFSRLDAQDKAVVEEIVLALNRDQLAPSAAACVPVACLHALYTLMKKGHVPLDSSLFWAYARPPRFYKLRLAALECLVDYAASQKKRSVLDELLAVLADEPDPGIRHQLGSLLATRPVFTPRSGDSSRLNSAALATRWARLMAAEPEPRLRALLIDAYAAMYGSRGPPACLTHDRSSNVMKITPPKRTDELQTAATSSSREDGEISGDSASATPRKAITVEGLFAEKRARLDESM